jgi:hypothetical protein
MPALFTLSAFATIAYSESDLPRPTQLLAELLPCEAETTALTGFPLGLGTKTPRLLFAVPASPNVTDRGLAIESYRVRVICAGSSLCGGASPKLVAWDSGDVKSNDTSTVVGTELAVGAIYTWSAQWSSSDGRSSPSSTGTFGIGLLTESDWAGTQWLGGGMTEFRARFNASAAAATDAAAGEAGLASLHIASAGGVVVRVNGIAIGGAAAAGGGGSLSGSLAPHDIRPWSDFTKSVSSVTYDLRPWLKGSSSSGGGVGGGGGGGGGGGEKEASLNEVSVSVGCGGWCPSPALAWAHSAREVPT